MAKVLQVGLGPIRQRVVQYAVQRDGGDVATCATTVNTIRAVLAAPPGLRTMADVPTVACFA
ncbi:MAG TPA: hypothetical protein VNA25_24625 [Phycisphaerae bacterium]|nr:hypothetical protein [Phycisphaerae bacterium]